jgi:hypothetical protein
MDLTTVSDIMLATSTALCSCLDVNSTGAPGNCGIYWSAPPDDLFCDCDAFNGTLDVWLENLSPTLNFPQPYQGAVQHEPLRTMASFAARLVRPCWPLPETTPNGIIPPTRATTEQPTLNLALDASVVFCCLLSDFTGGPQATSTITGGPCSNAKMGALTPDRNRAGCAGFTVRFSVDLGTCCALATGDE